MSYFQEFVQQQRPASNLLELRKKGNGGECAPDNSAAAGNGTHGLSDQMPRQHFLVVPTGRLMCVNLGLLLLFFLAFIDQ